MNTKAWFPYSRYRSMSVVDGLSRSRNHCQSLVVFQGRWRSFRVVGGRQKYFVLFPYDTNETTGSLAVFQGRGTVAEIDLKSIPATQSLTVFEDRYSSLQKFHSCFHIVVR